MDLVPDLVSDADRCTLKSSLRKPSLMGHVQIGVRASSLGVCEYGIAHLRFILHHVGWFFNRVSKIPYSLPANGDYSFSSPLSSFPCSRNSPVKRLKVAPAMGRMWLTRKSNSR